MAGGRSRGVFDEEGLDEVEEARTVRGSDIGHVGKVSGRIKDSSVVSVDRLYADMAGKGAVQESELGSIGQVFSNRKGVVESEVGSIDQIISERAGIYDSDVGEVGIITSDSNGIAYDSDVDSVEKIVAGTGINDSTVGKVDHIKGIDDFQGEGIRDSEVEEVGLIEADVGLFRDFDVGEVDEIVAEETGIRGNGTVDYVGSIDSGNIGVEGGVEIGRIESIDAQGRAVSGDEDQHISEIGSIDAGGTVLGYKANVDLVDGPVSTDQNLTGNTGSPTLFLGDLDVGGKLFRDSENHVIANQSVETGQIDGPILDKGGQKNLVITENLDLDEGLAYRSTVITPEGEPGTVDYTGDFSELLEEAEAEGIEFLENLKEYGTPVEQFSSVEGLLQEDKRQEEMYERGLRNMDISEGRTDELKLFTRNFPVDSLQQLRMADKMDKELGEKAFFKMMKVSDFGKTLSEMDPEYRSELFELLKTDKDDKVISGEVNPHTGEAFWYGDGDSSLGDKLFRTALDREFYLFAENEDERIEDLLEMEGEVPSVEGIFDDINVPDIEEGYEADTSDSPYQEVLDEMLEEYEQDIRLLSGLSELVDSERDPFGSLKPVKDLKDKEVARHAQIQNSGLEPEEVNQRVSSDPGEYTEWFEQHIDSKLQDYIQEAILEIGKDEAEELYTELTGNERPADEIDREDLAAMKVYARAERMSGLEDDDDIGWEEARDTVRTLLDDRNEVYERGENGEWLESHGYSVEQLVDPDISAEDSELFEDVQGQRDSLLRAEIDPDDIEVDTDRRQKQYLQQARQYMEELGIDEIEEGKDIEEMERKLKDLDSDLQQTTEYREAMEAVNNYKAAGNLNGGVPDELVFRVATPMETTLMGKDLQSCHDPELGSYGWAAISHSVKPNTVVMNAGENEDDIQARVKAYITEDEDLVYHHTSQYKKTDADLSEYFEEYMGHVANELGLGEPVHASDRQDWDENFELLEAHDQYLRE